MPAIASAAQGWEVFFATCALSVYVYGPFFSAAPQPRIEVLNGLLSELRNAIERFTFFPLRNLVVRLIIEKAEPFTLAEAIKRISGTAGMGGDPSAAQIASASQRDAEIVSGLMALTIGKLRNDVVHKYAFRPTRAAVEPCLTSELDVLYKVKQRLGVGDFLEHQAGATFRVP